MLTVKHRKEGTVSVVTILGTLDALSVGELKETIEPLLDVTQPRLVFDLGGVDHMDSSGIGSIVAAFKRARSRQGDLRIASLRGQPREVFALLQLDQAFGIYDDVDSASSGLSDA